MMILRHVTDPECPDCDAEIIQGADWPLVEGRPVVVLGHRGTCPTLRSLQRAEVPPLWRKAGRR